MTFPAEEFTPQRLWPAVWMLLRLRLSILWRGFRRARLVRKLAIFFLSLMMLVGLVVLFIASWSALQAWQTPGMQRMAGLLNGLSANLPVLVVSAVFMGVFAASFGVLLQTLYLAGDMDFLLSTPVPPRAVFIAKLLEAVLPNFAMICLLVLPILFGLGISAGHNLLYYPAVLLVLSALALAAAGLSALLVMLVVRVFPARRVAEVIGFIGAITTIVCSQTAQIAQWGEANQDAALQMMQRLNALDSAWSPLAWSGRGLSAIARGDWLSGLGLTTATLAVCAAAFAFSLVMSERMYFSGWTRLQVVGRKRRPKPALGRPAAGMPAAGLEPAARSAGLPGRLAARLAGWLSGPLPRPVRALMYKDWLVLRRDLKNLSQLITPLIFGVIYAITLLRSGPLVPTEELDRLSPAAVALLSNGSVYMSVSMSLFVGWMLLSRLGGMAFSHEGRSYWLLRSAPVSVGQLLLAKFLVAYLPTLTLSLLYLLGIWLLSGAGLGVIVYSAVAVGLGLAGSTGLSLTFGILGTNLTWEDPRAMQHGSLGCLGVLATMTYLPVIMALFFVPPALCALFDIPLPVGQVLGLSAGSLVSLGLAIVPPLLARKTVARFGE
ncbi:MAG: putative ABC transporter permease subunit [Chloroflexota bacterium]